MARSAGAAQRISRRQFGGCALATLLVAACTHPRATVAPEGRLEILGPAPGFRVHPPPPDWFTDGTPEGQLRIATIAGVPALCIQSGPAPFVFARRTEAILLATPFLSWAWTVEPQASGDHPVRLVVGFHGGQRGTKPEVTLASLQSPMPEHDRVIVLTWADTALARGQLINPVAANNTNPAVRYTVRGGRESGGTWWLETVDLADLYTRAWPGDAIGHVRVAFIGVAAAPGPVAAYVSGILLSR